MKVSKKIFYLILKKTSLVSIIHMHTYLWKFKHCSAAISFSKVNKMFLGYFDAINVIFYEKNKSFSDSLTSLIIRLKQDHCWCRAWKCLTYFSSEQRQSWLQFQDVRYPSHPKNYIFSFSEKLCSASKYPKNVWFNFKNRSTGAVTVP